MAIIGISSIHLLRTFIGAGNVGAPENIGYTETGIILQTVIHSVFILSAIGIAAGRPAVAPATGRAH